MRSMTSGDGWQHGFKAFRPRRGVAVLAAIILACTGLVTVTGPASAAIVRPTVSITTSSSALTAPATIRIMATATEPLDLITRVEFLRGNTLLGMDTTKPYSYNWSDVRAGKYTLTAKAFDVLGNVGTSSALTVTVTASATNGSAAQLHVAGNKLVNSTGSQVVLHGVDRSGTEYECRGHAFFDGPNDQASITAMKGWGINAVRVPLNEACWNGESYIPTAYRGANYQSAIKAYVSLLNANGMVAILDLHWSDGQYAGPGSGCSSANAVCQKPMPDAAQSVPFWKSVAKAFKGNNAVIFDLFNEPFPQAAVGSNEDEAWQCWRHGSTSCVGISYPVAGMQTLVNAVRGTGASNVIMLGGLAWANDLTQWLAYEPTDPDHDLAASWHSYNFNACATESCWNRQIAPVAAQVPVIAGEIGENDCADNYISPLMAWLDTEHVSYLAWAWNADFGCSGGPGLITDYNGTPTAYGAGYKSHVKSLTG
jgi:endoglucanase